MKDYRLLISHVGKDEDIAIRCVKALDITIGQEDNGFKIVPVYMESKTDGCFGDYMEWSEKAVNTCHGVLAIITDNTAATNVSDDGIEANVKVMYKEISFAMKQHKDVLVLRKTGVELQTGYNLILQNIKCAPFGNDNLDSAIEKIANDVILHAKRRFGGDPLLEYAGKVGATLKPSIISDTSAYLGRGDKIAEIDDCFDSGKRIVCITGFGGIGKTTLAKMYAKAHPAEPVVLQYCTAEETSLKNAVISLSMEYDSPDFEKMDIDEKYTLRIKQLGNLDTRTLIIIDNFNADFGNVNNREVLDVLSTLDNCKFLISSRRTLTRKDVGIVKVGKLDDKDIFDLFYRDSRCERTEENDDYVKQLIKQTNGHTMTIELAAKAVGMDENGVTLKEIVEGFLSVDAVTQVDDRHDGYDEYETIYAHLSKLFDLSHISDAEKNLLGALSFVARRGLTVSELKKNLTYETKDFIRLCALGYISKSEDAVATYSLHPLLSEFAFTDFAQSAEQFESIIKFLIFDKSQTTRNDSLADLDMRLDYAEHILARLSQMRVRTLFVRRSMSVSCNMLGDIAVEKGDIEVAEECYKQDYELAKAIYEETGTIASRRDLSVGCDRLGEIALVKGDIEVAGNYYMQCYELAKAIYEETGTIESRRDLAVSYGKLGEIANKKSDIEAAGEYYIQCYGLFKAIYEETGTIESRRDLAVCYDRLGDIAQKEGDIEAAEENYIQCFESSKANYEETGTIESRRDLAASCERLGNIAKAKGDIEVAEEYHKQGYDLAKAIYEETGTIESRKDLSESCDKLGDIAKAKGDIEAAEEYYKQGYELRIAIYEETGTLESRRDLSISCNRLGDIAKAIGDIKAAEEYFKQRDDLLKSISD